MDKQTVLTLSLEELFKNLHSSEAGLTESDVKTLTLQYGPNRLAKEKNPVWKIFLRQFRSALILLLVIAAIISFALQDFSDGSVIAIIVILNALISFSQEYRSEQAIEKLSRLIQAQVPVKRNGQTQTIPETQVVPGDLVLLREGDNVPADLRLVSADDLEVNESQLTGESVPITKQPNPSKSDVTESALVFAGSTIEKGEATGIVYATANQTQLGRIATLSEQTHKKTQYELSLQKFSSFLMKITFLSLAIVFIAKLVITRDLSHLSDLLIFMIALAVSVVPEPLPVIATVTMSHGALKLAKKHVIVKRLSSLEDFGNITLLCTDKTGTLTENKMEIEGLIAKDVTLFEKFAMATIEVTDERKKKLVNSYDRAFSKYIPEEVKQEAKNLHLVKEVPFDPKARRRRVLLKDHATNTFYLVIIGSVETLLEIAFCEEKSTYLENAAKEGQQGLRHLAIAYKEVAWSENLDLLEQENNLSFLGYVSLTDPLRRDAKHTINMAEKLGISIKILTGDSREVSEYVGHEIGLLKEGEVVYVGEDLDKMTPEELKAAVKKCPVFARISPEQKFLLIKTLKEDHIVGYQGDGINDAPSLKLADVAIAVEGATEVAQASADIVLLQKGLGTIINGIEYGRAIFVNINKYIKYTMIGNFGNFFALIVLYLLNTSLPLLAVQLLVTNLINDAPLITIATDNVERAEVAQPEKYNMHALMFLSMTLGTITALFELIFFITLKSSSSLFTETSLFLFIIFIQFVVIFSIRSRIHFWKAQRPSFTLLFAIFVGFVVSLAIPYIPIFDTVLSLTPLPLSEIAIILFTIFIYVFALDVVKVWYYQALEHKSSDEGALPHTHPIKTARSDMLPRWLNMIEQRLSNPSHDILHRLSHREENKSNHE